MARFEMSGSWNFKLKSLAVLCWSTIYVSLRRLIHGPLLPNWNWSFEVSTAVSRAQGRIAFDMPSVEMARAYQSSLSFYTPEFARVTVEAIIAPVKGHWYTPKSWVPDRTVLYLHGGGYAFYPQSYQNMIASIALAAGSKTFALDYRLTPKYPYPAQLEDALDAYEWLLQSGVKPQQLIVAGDSAGGNLMLALLLSLRDSSLPLPALGIGLCPWTDIGNSGASMTTNEKYDNVERRMAEKWGEWLCAGAHPRNPLISPLHADLRGLPPLYIQAGTREILYDMICAFAEKAKKQGVDIRFDVFENMNHDFQAFGPMTPESAQALKRIGEIIDERLQ